MYATKYYQSRGDSPAKNLRSRTGYNEKTVPVVNQISCYELPPTPGTPQSIPPPRSTRSTIKRLYNSPLEEELDLIGKSYPACSSSPRPDGLQTPQHFMTQESPNKFLDLDTPEKNKIAFSLQETAPLSFDCVLDPVPPLNDYSFSGLMEQMLDEDLSTPQHSPLSPPYSNETTNPYTPFTDSEAPNTPPNQVLDDDHGRDSKTLSSRKRKGHAHSGDGVVPDSKRCSLRGEKRGKESPTGSTNSNSSNSNNMDDSMAVVPYKSRRKTPVKEMRMFPRVEFPPTPEACEWHKMRDGCVKELRLINFMCHKNKHWRFGPHLNIITGENGSGKTAIQTAIMLVCGAKASTTGRADSLQMVIQRGESYTMIELVLSNHNGTHSKRRYGEEIRLRKQFTKSSSTTKVQLKDGTWNTLKKAALDSLLRPLQVHLNNPVQILTQKVATNFLNTQEASALYKSFKDITQISSAEEFLQSSQNNITVSKSTLSIKIVEYEDRKRKAEEAEAQFRKILEMEKYKGLCAHLRREKCSAEINQIEAVVTTFESQVSQIDTKISGIEGEKKQTEENKANMVSSHEKEKSIVSELRKEAATIEAQYEQAHLALREVSKLNQGIGKQIKLLNDNKTKLKEELKELERQRRDSLSVKANDDERIKRETEDEMERYNVTIAEASRQLEILRAEKHELETQQTNFKEKEDQAHALFQDAQTKLKDKVRGLKNIQDAEITKYDKFGSRVKTLVKRIGETRWKGRPPVGPLGAWFTVKKEHETYAPVIEETLGRTLRTFATDHPDDVNPLRHLIQEVYRNSNEGKPGITSVVSSNRNGEWWEKGKAVIPGYPTILDVLDIQHSKVLESLIDKEQIERIVLFKTEQEACHIFKDAKRVPRTCVYGVSKDCFKFTPSPNYKVQPLQQRKKSHFLQTTKFENAREELENEIDCLKAEVAEINDMWQQSKKITTGFVRQLKDVEAKIKMKSDELNRAKSLHRACKQILEDLIKSKVPDMASQNDFIEEQKLQLESTLSQREEELALQVAAKEDCDTKLHERDQESRTLKSQLDEVRTRIQACDDEKGIFQKQCDKVDKKIRECDNTLKTLNNERKKLQKELTGKKKELEKKISEDLKKGERIPTNRSPEDIQSDLEGRENFYKQNLHTIKMKEGVRRTAKKWKKSATEIHVQIEFVSQILGLVEPLTNVQRQHLERTKKAHLTNFQTYYQIFIQLRGYTGKALFDIADEKLFYYVSVDKKSEVKAQAYVTKNQVSGKVVVDWKGLKEFTMQLSGGERSFSTMAYISALRQIMPTPFFMLDEFEVFMDGGNKRVSMGILVEQAHSLFDAQFFVFTPHEPDELPQDDPFIKYFKLEHSGRNPMITSAVAASRVSSAFGHDQESPPSKRRKV